MFLEIRDTFYNHSNMAIYKARGKEKRKQSKYITFRKSIW